MNTAQGPDYKGAFRARMAENADDVLRAMKQGEEWIQIKITRHAQKYGLSEDEIRRAIADCRVLRFYFAKDPTRQSLHENVAAKFIGAIPSISHFRTDNDIYLARGEIVGKARLQEIRRQQSIEHSKTVDFIWQYDGATFYAYHKHTSEEGGAQDNQYKDLQSFVRACGGNSYPDKVFVALCDGPYYQARNGIAGKSRLDSLSAMANKGGKNIFAMTTADLPCFLSAHKWRR